MKDGYYNTKGELVSKAAFNKERKALIFGRFKEAQNDDIMIPIEDLDYYSGELIKLWNN